MKLKQLFVTIPVYFNSMHNVSRIINSDNHLFQQPFSQQPFLPTTISSNSHFSQRPYHLKASQQAKRVCKGFKPGCALIPISLVLSCGIHFQHQINKCPCNPIMASTRSTSSTIHPSSHCFSSYYFWFFYFSVHSTVLLTLLYYST